MSTEGWSRPRLQRRDLGPMIHDIGYQIYDAAEVMVEQEGISPRPTNTVELVTFAGRSVDFVLRALTEGDISKQAEPIDRLIDRFHNSRKTKTGANDSLTHGNSFDNVMREGLRTGVIAPLQLFRTVKIVEEYVQGGRKSLTRSLAIDADEAGERIASDEFQTMLHQLGMMTNGALGVASTETAHLKGEGDPSVLLSFAAIDHFGIVDSFDLDEASVVTGFNEAFLRTQKARKSQLRNTGTRLGDTGGCPVRHAEFPTLGEYATPYFQALDTPDAQPRNQGESLISRGARFVCAALVKSAEGAQS